jgi:hypothetical protein
MSHLLDTLRGLLNRLSQVFSAPPRAAVPSNTREFYLACKEMAFWSASDAGLDGSIEAFDGSLLHASADGLCTLRMTLRDSRIDRTPAQAAAAILRTLNGLRVLLLMEIDGSRFVHMAPNVNFGVRELGQNFTNRTGRAG